MIAPIDRFTSVPNVAEAVTPVNGVSIAGVQNTFATLLSDIPCGFAKQIEVFFLCVTQPIQHIVIRNYAANRTIFVDTQLTGAIAANTQTSVTFNGPFGQSYDILIQRKNGADTPAGTLAFCWTAAKA
jgi:hypothetical protein